jgi:UDP-2,3-diacylglucosamine pyrophosphatase LpxH
MKKEKKRKPEVVVLSDIHLGTYGCRAKALESYLGSIQPKTLILNGDIIDMWQFSKRYWPKSHMKVLKRIFTLLSKNTEVIYIPGNHDEMLRKFKGTKLGKLSIENKKVLEIGNQRIWIFHGDAFDVSMQHSRWLVRLGAVGYDLLILMNAAVNGILSRLGKSKISFSGKIKASVKSAVSFINSFEETVSRIAIDQGFDAVICGHIHQPADKTYCFNNQSVRYMNSGDWIENLTALEFYHGQWSLYRHPHEDETDTEEDPLPSEMELFAMLRSELLPKWKGSDSSEPIIV